MWARLMSVLGLDPLFLYCGSHVCPLVCAGLATGLGWQRLRTHRQRAAIEPLREEPASGGVPPQMTRYGLLSQRIISSITNKHDH